MIVAAVLVGSMTPIAAGAATDPLVGTWRHPGGLGHVQVTLTGSVYTGTVTVAFPSTNGCLHTLGKFLWQGIVRQADGTYTGANQGFGSGPSSGCPTQAQAITLRLEAAGAGALTLQHCSPGFACMIFTAVPPAPATTARPTTTLATTTTSTTRPTNSSSSTIIRPTTTSSSTTIRPTTTSSTTRPTTTTTTRPTTTLVTILGTPPPPASAPTAADPAFPRGYWMVHVTGHGTTSGPVKDDGYDLIGFAPNPDGTYKLADTYGGYIHYTSDFNTGPMTSRGQVCAAAKARGLPAREWAIYYHHIYWDCRPPATTTTKRPPPTTARPTSTTAPAVRRQSVALAISRQPRMGTKAHPNGMTSAADVNPKSWPVDIAVGAGRRPCPRGTYVWEIDGHSVGVRRGDRPCTFRYEAPKQGEFALRLMVKTAGTVYEGTGTVKVRDLLIFGLGDSNGSGEGNPDRPARGKTRAVWQDFRCDRSAKSFESLAAKALEDGDPSTTVTFVHLACSGASLLRGIVGPFGGVNDTKPPGRPIESQMSVLEKWKGERTVDGLIVSIGINDYGFADIVKFCVTWRDCPLSTYGDSVTLGSYTRGISDLLPDRYKLFADRLNRLKVDPGRVFITQYFDPTHDSSGQGYCDPLISFGYSPASRDFDRDEARWASEELLGPLNDAVADAALAHGWHLISGAPVDFRKHGYCAPARDRWIVTREESGANQGNDNGSLHANLAGNRHDAGLVVQAMKGKLK